MKFLVTGATGFIGWRVVSNLLARGIPVVALDYPGDAETMAKLRARAGTTPLTFVTANVGEFHEVMSVLHQHPDITHVIHLAYLMSAECEANPHLASRVNILGMVNMFEAVLQKKLQRLIFTSSETYYGAKQEFFGDRDVTEDDFAPPSQHHFTYGAMKVLNEFMAQKYVQRHGISLACVRPPVVFGHGRKRGSVLWAEDFATKPALGLPVTLPFNSKTRDVWIYVDDTAEQLVRLCLAPKLSHFAYNNGGESVTATELAAMVKRWLPDAQISFDETKPGTPLIDRMDGSRLRNEINFIQRPLVDAIRAHINEARASAGLPAV
ncbi:MAG: NAD(P)-dependent oxidoreductase [Nibricoccus sp.]